MFGGLKNSAPKAPRSLPNGNISQGAKTPKLKMNLQLFGNKNGSSNVGGNAIKGADNPKLLSETKVPKIGKQPGPTIDRNTGKKVGRFIGDEKGNIMIELKGGIYGSRKRPS